jgi:hypothetical protein
VKQLANMVDDAATVNYRQNVSAMKPLHAGQTNDGDFICAERMRIQVTIYSIEGIRRHDLKSPRQGKTQSLFSKKRNTPKSTSKVPTTALISLRGEIVKTLVPSGPLTFHEQRSTKPSIRGVAFWQDTTSVGEVKSSDEFPQSTFELSRKMKRQCFHRNTRIGQISQYYPERVDLVVGVARGSEILPLGTASIAVSGEEEGENLINISLKSLVVNPEKTNEKLRPKKGSYFDGDTYCYSLDANAILRVGVCVIPQHNYLPRAMTKLTAEEYISGKDDSVTLIELNDENSLIAKFKEAEKGETTNEVDGSHDSGFSRFVCGAMGCWSIPTQKPEAHSNNKFMEAKVLSMRAMSDVSGSTMRWQTRREANFSI